MAIPEVLKEVTHFHRPILIARPYLEACGLEALAIKTRMVHPNRHFSGEALLKAQAAQRKW